MIVPVRNRPVLSWRAWGLIYDRFSPVDPETSERIPTKLTVTMGRTTMTGENGEKWQVVLLMEDRMVLYYESGVAVQEGMEV